MTTKFLPNTQIDRFLIKAEVGRGGMGVVYHCFDPILKRPVALKLLAPHLGHDAKALTRFRREAALVASLKHPHIAMVYDFGEVEGQPYIAMEWIEGHTLKELLATEGALSLSKGPLSVARSLTLFDQLATALDYAHQHGVVHRDLKPANIIISHDNMATILDFGIAWLDSEPSITTTGSILGTPLYMSPEQVQGLAIDGRSDLYSLAIILYEMLAAQPPFESHKTNPNGLFHQQLFATPAPITEFNPSISLTIEEALIKGLSKKPDERFATGAEFSRALRALPVEPPSKAEEKAWQSRSWLLSARVVRLILPLLLMALLATQLFPMFEQVQNQLINASATATMPLTDEESEEEWWITAVNPYHSGFVEGDLSPFDQEADWVYYPESGEGTGLVATRKQLVFTENNLLSALDSTTGEFLWESRLSSDVLATPSIYLEEETTFLFVPTEEGELYALNLADGRLLWHIRAEEIVGTMRGGITVGDDDLLYATTDAGWLYVLEPWSGEINWALELSDSEEFSYPPTPLNLAVFLAGDTGTIYAIDSTTREVAWEAETIGQPSTPLVTQESWNMLLIGTEEGWLQAFSSITGNLVWQAQTGSVIVDIALDWEQVYAITIEGTLIAWDAFEGKEIDSHAFESEPRALFTDGEILLVGTQEGEIRYLEIESGEENHDGRLELDEPLIDFSTVAGQWFFVRTEEAIYGFER